MEDASCLIQDARCRMPDTRGRIQDTGYKIPDARGCQIPHIVFELVDVFDFRF